MDYWKKRVVGALVGLVVAAALFWMPGGKIPWVDGGADAYFESAMLKAGKAYATCRVVKATVSVIADSTVQLEPAGVGISLAAGKVLDPINDMAERLSNVLVTAIVSLGIQKLAYEIGVSLAPAALGVLLAVFSLLTLVRGERAERLRFVMVRLGALILLGRFLLPMTSAANDFLLERFFADEIARANSELSLSVGNFEILTKVEFPQYDGFFGTLESSATFVKARALALKDAISTMRYNLGDIIENMLTLTWLFTGIFLLQVIVLPLAVFWLMVKLVNALFATRLPVILTPHEGERVVAVRKRKPEGEL